MSLDYSQAAKLLDSIGQAHLLKYWERLASEEKNLLLKQISRLDVPTFQKQQQLLSDKTPIHHSLEPLTDPEKSGNLNDEHSGRQLMAAGATGCLILAGGQGTRLNFDGPKGMFPLSVVKHKSLFQLFAEKTVAAGKQAGRELPLALMTSAINHEATVEFFEKHHLFGLNPDQLSFFPQSSLPVLSQEGSLFLESPGKIAEGPDGNGAALHHFYHSGVWREWHQRGVRFLNLILIDNPLADPFDAELFGYHERQNNQLTVKCTLKKQQNEQVGVLTKNGKKLQVVEYSELPDSARLATNNEGAPLFKYANLSLFCVSMEFIEELATSSAFSLPLHKAFKEVNSVRLEGNSFQTEKRMAWKFEKFIFDLLPQAAKVSALLYPGDKCFAPLKNFSGENSIETVRQALQRRDQHVFASITGTRETFPPFEIGQEFYYPTPALLSKWQGNHHFTTGYIAP